MITCTPYPCVTIIFNELSSLFTISLNNFSAIFLYLSIASLNTSGYFNSLVFLLNNLIPSKLFFSSEISTKYLLMNF